MCGKQIRSIAIQNNTAVRAHLHIYIIPYHNHTCGSFIFHSLATPTAAARESKSAERCVSTTLYGCPRLNSEQHCRPSVTCYRGTTGSAVHHHHRDIYWKYFVYSTYKTMVLGQIVQTVVHKERMKYVGTETYFVKKGGASAVCAVVGAARGEGGGECPCKGTASRAVAAERRPAQSQQAYT